MTSRPRTRIPSRPRLGCDRLVSKAKVIENQVPVAIASPAGVLKLDTHSSSEADLLDSSLPPVQVAPMVSPFLYLDDSESDIEMLGRHVSSTPHDAMLARWRNRVASRSSSPVIPLNQSLSRHTSPDTTIVDSSTPSRFVYPPPTRNLQAGNSSSESSVGPSRKRCRSPTTAVPSFIPALGALVPTRADLLLPRNRFRDSYSSEDNVKEDIDADVLVDIEADATVVEVAADIDVEAGVDTGIGIEIGDDIEDEDEGEAESNNRWLRRLYMIFMGMLWRYLFIGEEQHETSRLRLRRLEAFAAGLWVFSLPMFVCTIHGARRTVKGIMENRNSKGNGDRNGGGNGNRNRGGNGNGNSNRNDRGVMPVTHECTYHDFVKCQPLNFKGTKGVVGLTRWFEKIETVFHFSNCRVRNEIQKMETELWTLTMKGNDLTAYTQRFQELTMLCTKMVPEEEDQVEKFIGGLPDNIQGNVIASEPMKLQDAIRIANNLMDQKLKGYATKSVENKRMLDFNQKEKPQHTTPYTQTECWRTKKDTKLPQTSVPQDLRADKAVLRRGGMDTGGSPKRQDTMRGTPAQTRSERVLEKPNKPPLSEGYTSGSGKGRMEHQFELTANVPLTPHDSPLPGGYTPGSDDGRLQLQELMTMCIKLSKQVLDLEKEKDAQAVEIFRLLK
ncbi:putative reverse transcriptase domain-containing protein [Tanacetum coccineum]